MSAACWRFGQSKALIGTVILIFIVAAGETAFGTVRNSEDTTNSAYSANDDPPVVLLAQSLREWGKDFDRRGMRGGAKPMRPRILEDFRSIALQISAGDYESAKSALEIVEKTTLRKHERIALLSAYGFLLFKEKNYKLALEHYRKALKIDGFLSQFKGATRHTVYVLEQRTANPVSATVEEKERAKKSVEIASRQKPRMRFHPGKAANGLVVVGFSITETGATEDIYVLYALPPGIVERSAVKAISRAKYDPVLIDGKAVRVEDMVLLISFE